MKKLLFGLIAGLFAFSGQSQPQVLQGDYAHAIAPGAAEVRMKTKLAIPNYIAFKPGERIAFESWENYIKTQFQLPESYDFSLLNVIHDELGMSHYRYQQSFSQKAIEMAHLIVHVKNNEVYSINGLAYRTSLNSNTSLSEADALDFALSAMGANAYKWQDPAEEAHLKWETGDSEASYFPKGELVYMGKDASELPEDLVLCYRFNIYATDPLGRKEIYVDAQTGEIQMEEELIHTNIPGIANTGYSGTQTIITDSFGDGLFRLRETLRGNGIFTYDMNKSTSHAQAVDFIDSNNVWNNFNANKDQFATDAHWGAEVMYDYLDSIHNRNSIDNNGFALRSYVHYGNNYNNAFWDGQRMTYGDGNSTTNPLTSLDIAGHEIAHGLTNFTSALIYRKESGALNESFSDIFGAAVEFHGKPSVANWLLGEDIGSAFRNMANPNQYSDPDTYNGLNWIGQLNCTPTNGNDWCGVHTNSGVQNYWFYLLTVGGSGTNDIGNSFSVNGIGIVPAAKIAYRNLTVYLTPGSDYNDAVFYGIKSAIDLFGSCTPEVEATTNAWYAVGLGNAYTPGVSAQFAATFDSIYCSVPALVSFSSNSNNVANFRWEFGDGDTSDLPKPVHVYDSVGLYTVSLFVDGGVCGSDTIIKTAYISVDTNNFCSYSMDRNSKKVLTDCSARLYDNGGLNSNYEVQSYDTVTISPANADWIELIFDTLSIETGYGANCNHDYLEIFDGASTSARSLGRFCSANMPDTIRSSSPSVTLVMASDNLVSASGFIMEWFCQTSAQAPMAAFEQQFDSTCTGRNKFYDHTQGGVSSWLWNFGDGNTSTEQNPRHEYQSNGTFTVSLTATNSQGSSTSTSKQVYVNRPAMPITRNDTNCINGNFKLAASGPGTHRWFVDQSSKQILTSADTFRLNALSQDTSLYVESFNQAARVIGVPIFITGSGMQSDTTAELYFDVQKPTLIESVILRSNRRGDRRIDLKNNQGEIIDSRLINVPNIPTQISLNFEVAPGTNYSLSIGNRNPGAYVNTTGANYPYQFSNFMSITGSSMGSGAFPFFYYFIARELPCISPRALVQAVIDTSCIITGIDQSSLLEQEISVYPVPSSYQVNVDLPGNELVDNLRLFDLQSRAIKPAVRLSGNRLEIQMANLPEGIYLLRFTYGGELVQKKIIKVNQ